MSDNDASMIPPIDEDQNEDATLPDNSCQVCADRGETHVPEDNFETYSRED